MEGKLKILTKKRCKYQNIKVKITVEKEINNSFFFNKIFFHFKIFLKSSISRFLKVRWIVNYERIFETPFYLKFKLHAVSQMSYIRSEISISSGS